MPHIVLEGSITLRDIFAAFQPRLERRGNEIVKFEAAYLEHSAQGLLVETLAVAGPRRQKFFLRITPRENGVTVRLEPVTDPEKTETVKRSLALFAAWVQGLHPGIRTGATNIGEFLEPR